MPLRARDLFEAYQDNKLPKEAGVVLSSSLQEDSPYCRYELIAYRDVRALYLSEDGLTFQTDGNKLFILAEPPAWPWKSVEPFRREAPYQIPHRFSELDILDARSGARVMISREPILTYSAFTVPRPRGIDFAFLFYILPDMLATIDGFVAKTLNDEAQIPLADAEEAARRAVAVLKRCAIWPAPAP